MPFSLDCRSPSFFLRSLLFPSGRRRHARRRCRRSRRPHDRRSRRQRRHGDDDPRRGKRLETEEPSSTAASSTAPLCSFICRRFQSANNPLRVAFRRALPLIRAYLALEWCRKENNASKPSRSLLFFFRCGETGDQVFFRSFFATFSFPRTSLFLFFLSSSTLNLNRASPSSSPSAGPPPAPCSRSPLRSSSGAARASREREKNQRDRERAFREKKTQLNFCPPFFSFLVRSSP